MMNGADAGTGVPQGLPPSLSDLFANVILLEKKLFVKEWMIERIGFRMVNGS
jgi:hypothetical protein